MDAASLCGAFTIDCAALSKSGEQKQPALASISANLCILNFWSFGKAGVIEGRVAVFLKK